MNINIITNILAIVIVVATAAQGFLTSGQDFNWYNLIMAVVVAVIAWLTGDKKK
jgi:hypothetical protein